MHPQGFKPKLSLDDSKKKIIETSNQADQIQSTIKLDSEVPGQKSIVQ